MEVTDQHVLIALITGCTTFAVACVRAAAQVAVAWIQASHGQAAPPREIEPPAPDPLGDLTQLQAERHLGTPR
jgi:hypothetical protein